MTRKSVALMTAGFLALVAGEASATLLNPIGVSGSGTYYHSADLIIDGIIPSETTHWQDGANVYWYGAEPIFTINYGAIYTIEDVTVSVDNNDDYIVEYSANGTDWYELFKIYASYGEIPVSPGGMDTMTTIYGDSEYVASIDFGEAVSAQYLRISAVGGDGYYSVGEVQAFGTSSSPVPEPSTMLLLGAGLAGMAFISRKRKN
nr:PEP-CTERM sorting domain-containing protein [uncultured Desulfobulbus sp.]